MTTQTWLPDFVDQVPGIELLDPLGAFLTGNADPAPVTYRFDDVLKLSGHCCPTVAGAYALCLTALEQLYKEDETPVRGEIAIDCPGHASLGALGPFTQVLSYLTGACADNGFQGLGARFRRQGLLSFRGAGSLTDPFYFTRLDTGKCIGLAYDASQLPMDEHLGPLMAQALEDQASAEELAEMGRRWQARVRPLLLTPEHRRQMMITVD